MNHWLPTSAEIKKSNIGKMMRGLGIAKYQDFWRWSVENKNQFWEKTVQKLQIKITKPFDKIVDVSEGVENAKWLFGAKLNIVDSCFQNDPEAIAIVFRKPNGLSQEVTQQELEHLVNRIANSLYESGLKIGDTIAIDMPMTLEAVAIYLAAIKAGIKVVTIADSFTSNEIKVRIAIAKPKIIFTQDVILRAKKEIQLYKKIVTAAANIKIIVIPIAEIEITIRNQDLFWKSFLRGATEFESVKQVPEETITILFSSGTTGVPKAIPWNHTTPIKAASDGYYHQDIHQNDVVCWPTNLGWMMGPWLVFATLINKATIALYNDAPMGGDFGQFIENTKVTMLGVIPSIVKQWKISDCMKNYDWSAIKCFSTTGEASNPLEMEFLMRLGGNKPVIEYCGGTEVGGGYVASTLVQPNIASQFSTQTLGGEFVLIEDDQLSEKQGEVFLIPPIMGLSTTLLNKDHYKKYYENTPKYKGVLRRHGDALERFENGYYKMLGRVDDTMNLGGIKVSTTQIESEVNSLAFVLEAAAIAIAPKNGGPNKLVIYYVESELEDIDRLKQVQEKIKNNINPLFKVADLIKLDALPRTASNKVMRRTLRDQY